MNKGAEGIMSSTTKTCFIKERMQSELLSGALDAEAPDPWPDEGRRDGSRGCLVEDAVDPWHRMAVYLTVQFE